jgi:hypothetical protein
MGVKYLPFKSKPSPISSLSKSTSQNLLLLEKGQGKLLIHDLALSSAPTSPLLVGKSLSVRTVFNFYRQIVENGIAAGKSSVPQFSSGIVNNGGVVGALYDSLTGSSTYGQIWGQNGIFFSFGNNSLNIGGVAFGGLNPLPSSSADFFTFAGNSVSTVMKSGGGKVLVDPYGVFQDPVSGSARALYNLESSLTTKSIALGRSLVKPFTGGSIIGGEFSGTIYAYRGTPAYTPSYRFVFAFGNNALNASLKTQTTIITNPQNYIEFANGTIQTISSAELFTTAYIPVAHQAAIFAIGSNALNNFPNSTPVTPANFTSYIYF